MVYQTVEHSDTVQGHLQSWYEASKNYTEPVGDGTLIGSGATVASILGRSPLHGNTMQSQINDWTNYAFGLSVGVIGGYLTHQMSDGMAQEDLAHIVGSTAILSVGGGLTRVVNQSMNDETKTILNPDAEDFREGAERGAMVGAALGGAEILTEYI